MISKLCSNCGCEFEARRNTAKFCSPACRQQDYRIRNGQQFSNVSSTLVQQSARDLRLTCPHCGKGYWQGSTGRKRQYCSDSCRVSANRRKVNATRNLIRKLSKRGASMDKFIDAANVGTVEFENLVKRYGFVYDGKNGVYFEDHRQSDFFGKSPSHNFGVRK